MKTETPTLHRNVLDALAQCSRPCDAYGLAKKLRETPMAVGRALFALERQGAVASAEDAGTANDLARLFELKNR